MSSIVTDLANFGKVLEKQIKSDVKQVKFAAMKAINEVAFNARKELMEEYGKSFKVRNKNLPKAVQIKKATKENLTAEVSFPKDWMKINTTGGEKKPEKGKSLAIPSKDVDAEIRLSSGKVKPSMRPGALLKYSDANPKRAKGQGKRRKKPKPFKTVSRKGRQVIGIRNGDGVKWLYAFTKSGKVEKRWDFDVIVKKVAKKELPKEFDKQLKKALATAK